MDEYNDIRELLKSRQDVKASDELRHRVRLALGSAGKERRSIWKWISGGVGISAVVAILIIALLPKEMTAKEVLSDVIGRLQRSNYIEMVVEVRTRPVENFRYIDVNEEFIRHNLYISTNDSVLAWKIDKGDRGAIGRGRDIRTWISSLNLGWHFADHSPSDILGYVANLLLPKKILETELEECIDNRSAQYSVSKNGNEIVLTVHASEQGNFENPYLLNTSISESENIRRYIIDADSKELKSASVNVVSGGLEITVLRIISINYGPPANVAFQIPADIHFVEIETPLPGLKGLSAEEAATAVLNAFSDWDTDILDKVMSPTIYQTVYRDRFQGAALLSVGHAFSSGNNNSMFVPYEIRLRDGSTQRHNIALQETDSGGWIVVGGL